MTLDLRGAARAGTFKPSAWVWENPDHPRLHVCFARWLRDNAGRAIDAWSPYECDHYNGEETPTGR